MNSIKINPVTPKPQNGPAGKPPAKNDRLKSDGKKPKKTNDKPIKAQKNQKTELAHAQKETGKGKELCRSENRLHGERSGGPARGRTGRCGAMWPKASGDPRQSGRCHAGCSAVDRAQLVGSPVRADEYGL